MKAQRLAVLCLFIAISACDSSNTNTAADQPPDRFVELREPGSEPERPSEQEVDSSAVPSSIAELLGPETESEPEVPADTPKVLDTISGKNKPFEDQLLGERRPEPSVAQKSVTVTGYGGLGLSGVGRGGGGSIGMGSGTGYGRGSIGVGSVYRSSEAAYTESYKHYGTNRFTEASKDRYSTFAADVDTASYTIARRKILEGSLPPAASVRVEEFVNYFSYSYGRAKNGPFAVDVEAAPSPFSDDPLMKVLRVGVQTNKLTAESRKPVHITFLVDVSGSMNRPDRIGLAKQSMSHLVENLREEDTVAITTYAGRTELVLEPTPATQREHILSRIDGLKTGGGTAMGDGLELAYHQAAKMLKPGEVSRVIVLSDGDANIGRTSHEEILKRIAGYVEEGVTLSTIGFGMGNYKDTMMEQLANKGNGNYAYIDDFKEAKKVFGEQLDGTLQVVAKDVKFQVEFHPEHVETYRLIGYENRDIADKDFRNDAVDAGEVGAGHRVTALFEVRLKHVEASAFATVRIRHKPPEEDVAVERKYPLTLAQIKPTVGHASKDFQFAVAVAGFAEILRGSEYAKNLSYDLLLEVAESAAGNDKRRKEFVSLVKKARHLKS